MNKQISKRIYARAGWLICGELGVVLLFKKKTKTRDWLNQYQVNINQQHNFTMTSERHVV